MTAIAELETDVLTAPMPTRPLGKFGWNASVLTLGGVKWDVLNDDAGAVAVVHRAMELGVNTFDTAHVYGNGESERKLGLAMQGVREKYWINTKVIDRTYDGAMRQMETSLKRLQTDYVDLMFVHSMDSEDQRQQIIAPNSVLKAVEEMKAAGHIKHIGVSGHWVKDVQARILTEYPFEAVLFPAGLFNLAYKYNFLETVLPVARSRGMAVLGMKIYGAGRVKKAASLAPYLRYSLHQDVDTLVIGMDTPAHVEATVRLIKQNPPILTEEEIAETLPEAVAITQEWDEHEFSWVQGYKSSE
jgi:uncharacterized protein